MPPSVAPATPLQPPIGNTALADVNHKGGIDDQWLWQQANAKILRSIVSLAAQIRAKKQSVGYAALAVFAILKRCRPFIWEGATRIDIVKEFAPLHTEWCHTECVVDGVWCFMEPRDAGHAVPKPVSKHFPLGKCQHFLACIPIVGFKAFEGFEATCSTEADEYYRGLGKTILGTVCDGDCGPDLMLSMLSMPSNDATRQILRDDIADWILQVAEKDWFWDILIATQELDASDVKLIRESRRTMVEQVPTEEHEGRQHLDGPVPEPLALNEAEEAEAFQVTPAHLEALAWITGRWKNQKLKLVDDGLEDLAKSLPAIVLNQTLAQYDVEQHKVAVLHKEPVKIMVHSHLISSRMQVAEAFNAFLVGLGWQPPARIPRGSCKTFHTEYLVDVGKPITNRALLNWHAKWRKSLGHAGKVQRQTISPSSSKMHWRQRRRACNNQGRPFKCTWLRNALYEWYTSMRYNIDWDKVRASVRTVGLRTRGEAPKALARFTRQLVRQKAQHLLNDYCAASLLVGCKPIVPTLRSEWFRGWESDYGLSMRNPNRKYKVPKWLMLERLKIAWLNFARFGPCANCVMAMTLRW